MPPNLTIPPLPEGPEPKTDREFLVQIYGEMKATRALVGTICNRCEVEEKRMQRLERWQWKATGAVGLGCFAFGAVGMPMVENLLKWHP